METNEEHKEKRKPLYHIEIHCDTPNPYWIVLKTKAEDILTHSTPNEYVEYPIKESKHVYQALTERSVGKMNNDISLNETQISIAKALASIPGIDGTDKLISRIYFTHDGMRLILKHHRRDGEDTDLIEYALKPWIEPYYRIAVH